MLRSLAYVHLALLLWTHFAAATDKPKSLFNGKDLSGWEGDPAVWTVEDGAIVGQATADAPIEHNTFLIWKDGEVGDFRLRLEYRIEGDNNSGVQYRSRVVDPKEWIVAGYQADIDANPTYSGILYDERGTRQIIAGRGERVIVAPDGQREVTRFATAEDLQKHIRPGEWNKYVIVARGPRLRHKINGKLMSETVDRERGKRAKSGVLALQVHQGPPMTVRFRNIYLEELQPRAKRSTPKAKQE